MSTRYRCALSEDNNIPLLNVFHRKLVGHSSNNTWYKLFYHKYKHGAIYLIFTAAGLLLKGVEVHEISSHV
jgi:hypothetical protein